MRQVVFPTAVVTPTISTMATAVRRVVLDADAYGTITFNKTAAVHMFRVTGSPSVFRVDIMLTPTVPAYRIAVVDKSNTLWTQLHDFCAHARVITPHGDSTLRISPITYIGPHLVLDASRLVIPCTVIRCTRTQRCQRVVAFCSATITGIPVHVLTLYLTKGPLSQSITLHSAMAQHMLRSCTVDTCDKLHRCTDAVSPEAIAASDVGLPLAPITAALHADIVDLFCTPPASEMQHEYVDTLCVGEFDELVL